MIEFKKTVNLASHMLDHLDNEDNLASVIGNRQLIISVMQELLNHKNIFLSQCLIEFDEFCDKEYVLYLYDDTDSDKKYLNIEKCNPTQKGKYLSVGGYVLFHEDVNSKILIDMQNNEFMPLCGHDWFVINDNLSAETNEEDTCKDPKNNVAENDCETLFVYKNPNGDPEGFSRSWTAIVDGKTLYCSQIYYSAYPKALYSAATCLGVKL